MNKLPKDYNVTINGVLIMSVEHHDLNDVCEHRETKNFICQSCGENTYKYYKQFIESTKGDIIHLDKNGGSA